MVKPRTTYLFEVKVVSILWTNVAVAVLSLIVFLSGLSIMRRGLEGMGASKLNQVLHTLVSTPTRGIFTGTIVTALVQSSAAITAITVGMVASGTIAFREALGVVLGSNVGSTITPQLLTLNLSTLAIPCLVIGIVGYIMHNPRYLNVSMALVGFACILIALVTLKMALHPLAAQPWMRQILQDAGKYPVAAAIAGCLASALVQSSTAITVITMALATTSVIPLTGAVGIVLGANVGTCLTSVIASMGQGRPAQQVALSHVVLNVGGVLLFLPLLKPFTTWMMMISSNPAQQIANAHTAFNIVCTLIVWPATDRFAKFIEWVLPDNRYA